MPDRAEVMTITSFELVVVWAFTGALAAILTGCSIRHREQPALSPWQTLVQALTTATLFATLAWRFGPNTALLAPSWLAVTGVTLAERDLRTRRLPNRLVLPNYLVIPSLAAVTILTGAHPAALVRATLGMVAILIFYGLLYMVFPGQLGGGDLKIAGPVGFLLAWQSWSALLTGTLLAWMLATLALPLLSRAAPPRSGDLSLPLGPFVIGAALVTILLLPWDLSTAPFP